MLVKIGKKYHPVPSSWNELSSRQLAGVMQVFTSPMRAHKRNVMLFQIISGLSFFRLALIGAENFDDLFYLTGFLYEKNTLTKNVMPQYKHRFGPAGNFDNLLISEFVFTEMFYGNYKNEELSQVQKKENLHKLIAVLYRPGKRNYNKKLNSEGDIREPFNDNVISFHEAVVARWPRNIQLSIVHWYEGCREHLVEEFPEVFTSKTSGADASKYGLWDIMYNMADKGIFGDFAKVEAQLLKTILMAITKIMAESETLKKAV